MTNAELSKLLFEAREEIEMWADVVESHSGQPASQTRDVLARLDAYRAERGWPPHGYGHEHERDMLRLEFEFWEGDHDAAIGRLSQVHDALVGTNVLKRSPTQLGFRAPWPDESERTHG